MIPLHSRATERHLPLDRVNAPHVNPDQSGRLAVYSIYLPMRDGRLSCPWKHCKVLLCSSDVVESC